MIYSFIQEFPVHEHFNDNRSKDILPTVRVTYTRHKSASKSPSSSCHGGFSNKDGVGANGFPPFHLEGFVLFFKC